MHIGYLGKLPSSGDFLRGGIFGEPAAEFERWVEEGLQQATSRVVDWPAAFDGGAIYAFVYRSQEASPISSLLCGLICPSHDAVGRRYPLALFTQVPELLFGGAPHLLPLLLGDFFQLGGELLLASGGLKAQEFFEAVRLLPAPRLTSLGKYGAEYHHWAQTTLWGEPFQVTYAQAIGPNTVFALDSIAQCAATVRQQERSASQLSLRLPLGGGGSAAVAFWVDLVRRLAGWKKSVPSLFWSPREQQGQLMLQLGLTPPWSLGELWAPSPRNEYVCDLIEPSRYYQGSSAEQVFPRLPATLQYCLNRPEISVEQLLSAATWV